MNGTYQYTPYLLLMFASATFLVALAVYAWPRRYVPGARPFAMWMLFTALWAVSRAMEVSSTDWSGAILWFKLQRSSLIFIATFGLCFALEYAQPGRWLSLRTFALLAVPVLATVVLIFTNEIHHLTWTRLWFDGRVQYVRGWVNWIMQGYGVLLYLASYFILIRLFVRSPLHRWPVAVCMLAQSGGFACYLLNAAQVYLLGATAQYVLTAIFVALVYGLALFYLRMFDLIPVAREMVVGQMRDGLVVLDTQQRVADLNSAAERILDIPPGQAGSRPAAEVLRLGPDWSPAEGVPCEGAGAGFFQPAPDRHFEVFVAPLKRSFGLPLGHMVLYHDVTEQQRSQARLVADQRMVATLEERERLARELHDTLVQTLAAIRVQAETADLLLDRGDTAAARTHLTGLADAAQAAYLDLRDYIKGVDAARGTGQDFFSTLRQYLAQFDQNYQFTTRLDVPARLEQAGLEEHPALHVLRIVQEGLHNVRKHAGVACAAIRFAQNDTRVELHIEDEGRGFDSEQTPLVEDGGFGLRSMRERAQSIGGSFQVHSMPGRGTHIAVAWPHHHLEER